MTTHRPTSRTEQRRRTEARILEAAAQVFMADGYERTNPLTRREKLKFKYLPLPDPLPCLAYLGNEQTMRLACMTRVDGDIVVESCPELNLFGENFFS